MTRTELMQQIIQKQDELLKIDDDIIIVYRLLAFEDSFSTQANKLENERDFLYEKFRDIKNELASLRQQLEEVAKIEDDDIVDLSQPDYHNQCKHCGNKFWTKNAFNNVCPMCGNTR